jgi:small subunit ribosomal protein S1
VFTLDSVHKGTIIEINDKGAVAALPYGVEGFVPRRHMAKEDNSHMKMDETLDFKVIEFSKENKKIILSHTKVYQDVHAARKARGDAEAMKEERSTRRAVKRIKDNVEKTTLGDISALAEIKSGMEQEAREKLEKMSRQKKTSPTKEEPKPEENPEPEAPKAEPTDTGEEAQ